MDRLCKCGAAIDHPEATECWECEAAIVDRELAEEKRQQREMDRELREAGDFPDTDEFGYDW